MPLDDLANRYANRLFSQEVRRIHKERQEAWQALQVDLHRRGFSGESGVSGFAIKQQIALQVKFAGEMLRARIHSLKSGYVESKGLTSASYDELVTVLQDYYRQLEEQVSHLIVELIRARHGGALPEGFAESCAKLVENGLAHSHADILEELGIEKDRLLLAERDAQSVQQPIGSESKRLSAWRRAEVLAYWAGAVGGVAIAAMVFFPVGSATSCVLFGIGVSGAAVSAASIHQKHLWEQQADTPAVMSRPLIAVLTLVIVAGVSFSLMAYVWARTPSKRSEQSESSMNVHPPNGPADAATPGPASGSRAGTNPAPSEQPGPGPIAGFSDGVSVVVTPANPKGGAITGSFTTTGRGEYEVDILQAPPEELLFKPPGTIVNRPGLPADLVVDGHKLTIRKFTDKGFVIFDNGWRNISITVSLIKAASKLPGDVPSVSQRKQRQPRPVPRGTPVPAQGKERSSSVEDELAVLVQQGGAIQQEFIDHNDDQLLAEKWSLWRKQVGVYLGSRLGGSYAVQFESAHGNAWMGCPVGHSVKGCGYWQDIQGKKDFLNALITETRNHSTSR